MRLVFAEPAARDLDEIIDYVAQDNPRTAERLFRAIVAAAKRVQDFPEIGHVGRLPNTREWPVAAQPYVIVYQRKRDTVTILAVFHGARDLTQALRERRAELKRKPTNPGRSRRRT